MNELVEVPFVTKHSKPIPKPEAHSNLLSFAIKIVSLQLYLQNTVDCRLAEVREPLSCPPS